MHVLIFILTTILLLGITGDFVYAQNSEAVVSLTLDEKIQKLDGIMTAQITATLTGLSLAGGSFLTQATKDPRDHDVIRINLARRSFIKAFLMFLMCTVFIFIFDFLQILSSNFIIAESFFDIIITYSFFGVGLYYLIRAAKSLYVTYGVRSDQ